MDIFSQITKEIDTFLEKDIDLAEGYNYNQYKLIRRLNLYMNKFYPTGKIDSQGDYKYWYDIITPRVNSEIKNIDFDTKDILIFSERKRDFLPIFLANAALGEWMRDKKMDAEINDSIENGSAWGNLVWKKIKDGFIQIDLKEFYILNQKAESLQDSAVIEHHLMTQSQLRKKSDVWDNVEDVIKNNGDKFFREGDQRIVNESPSPIYEIYERNGEVSRKVFNQAKGLEGGSEEEYIMAKIIVAGLGGQGQDSVGKNILFCEELKDISDVYKEYHRGKFNGRWFREGLYEILFDLQTRANEIGNQIAKGLQWSSKTIFRSSDRQIAQNVLTDLENGDIIKSQDLQQVQTRMEGMDQLIADWNRVIQHADSLANSFEVTQGENLPSGTPFRLGALLNVNANKLFDYIQEKIGIAMEDIFEDWILPDLVKSLKTKKVLRMTNEAGFLKRWYEMLVNSWYVRNLIAFGPHPEEYAVIIKEQKIAELSQSPETVVKLEKKLFEDMKPRMQVVISGENVRLAADLETLSTFIQLEADPIRRSALIEIAMNKKGIDVSDLPKTEAPEIQTPASTPQGGEPSTLDNILSKQAVSMAV